MPDWLKKHVEEQMNDPIKRSDSALLKLVKDWIDHPERSKIYRDQIMFNHHADFHPQDFDHNPNDWKIEVPLFSIDF